VEPRSGERSYEVPPLVIPLGDAIRMNFQPTVIAELQGRLLNDSHS